MVININQNVISILNLLSRFIWNSIIYSLDLTTTRNIIIILFQEALMRQRYVSDKLTYHAFNGNKQMEMEIQNHIQN